MTRMEVPRLPNGRLDWNRAMPMLKKLANDPKASSEAKAKARQAMRLKTKLDARRAKK